MAEMAAPRWEMAAAAACREPPWLPEPEAAAPQRWPCPPLCEAPDLGLLLGLAVTAGENQTKIK